MSLATIGGSMLNRLYSVASAAPAIEQNVVFMAYMNSLLTHGGTYNNVPIWLHRIVAAEGTKSISSNGQFGFPGEWSLNPPNFSWSFDAPIVSAGDPFSLNTWPGVNAQAPTHLSVTNDNFNGVPVLSGMETNPRIGPAPASGRESNYVDEYSGVIDAWMANATEMPIFLIHEGPAMGNDLIPGDLAGWKLRTTTAFGFTGFFDDLVAALKADYPAIADKIQLVPTARVLVSVMNNTPASALTANDWFEDSAPHGNSSAYLIYAATFYSQIYQEVAPEPDFTSAGVHSSITSNWSTIASHIATQVGI